MNQELTKLADGDSIIEKGILVGLACFLVLLLLALAIRKVPKILLFFQRREDMAASILGSFNARVHAVS